MRKMIYVLSFLFCFSSFAAETEAPHKKPESATEKPSGQSRAATLASGKKKSDVELARQIRDDLQINKELSVAARNINIVAKKGKVTLKGQVDTAEERLIISETAGMRAGAANIKDRLTVRQSK